ncbi:MAG: thymidylate kinase [Nitrospirae bacterium]|nr:thymidylate kinase [Nitrospirota bacterium]
MKRFYGHGIPGVDLSKLAGKLIVIEGADGSGRTTLIDILKPWLEGHGHAVTTFGIKRSTLVGQELELAKQGNTLGKITMGLFYATDFADQLEHVVVPALRAGFVVLADRYIYTLMARELVRGVEPEWLTNLYHIALIPDSVFYLSVSPQILLERNFAKNPTLDYWESGMDIGLHDNVFDSFIIYQKRMRQQFLKMKDVYGFQVINANRPIWVVAKDLQQRVASLMNIPL